MYIYIRPRTHAEIHISILRCHSVMFAIASSQSMGTSQSPLHESSATFCRQYLYRLYKCPYFCVIYILICLFSNDVDDIWLLS